jgi:RNA polymerase sigma-70 factor (ECF subfamily)
MNADNTAKVIALKGPYGTNEEIVDGLMRRDPRAAAVFYDRFGDRINRLVWRLLGADDEHDDVVNHVFVQILSSVGKLKKVDSLADWITGVTVNTVHKEIRSRKYRRIVQPVAELPEPQVNLGSHEDKLVLRCVYTVLQRMKADDRIVFVLRFVEGNTLNEVAQIGGYSLATAKRRVVRAKAEFSKRAVKDPFLASHFKEMNDGT